MITSAWDVGDAQATARGLLATADAPTAIFAANNVLGEGVWRAAVDLGLAIPDDLSLVCFDDVPWMSMVRPGITAVAQDAAVLGEAAVTRLVERITTPAAPVRTVMLTAVIRRRGSVAAPRGRS